MTPLTKAHQCPSCLMPVSARQTDQLARVLSGFLTMEQVSNIEAQLCELAAEADAFTPPSAAQLCAECLVWMMAGSV